MSKFSVLCFQSALSFSFRLYECMIKINQKPINFGWLRDFISLSMRSTFCCCCWCEAKAKRKKNNKTTETTTTTKCMSNTPKSQQKKNLHIECVCVWWSYLANAYVNVIMNVYIIMLRTVFHKICEILKHRKCRYEHSCSLGMGIFLHTSIERNKIYINICTTLYCLWSSLAANI